MASGSAELKIFLLARPVESFRGDWSQAAESMHDPGVALDWASWAEPPP